MNQNTVEPRHCDDYIDDVKQPICLRRFLRYKRWPAIMQARARQWNATEPQLFATLKADLPKKLAKHCRYYGVQPGSRVRVVMASRLGDVGITTDLVCGGYQVRVDVESLEEFSDKAY